MVASNVITKKNENVANVQGFDGLLNGSFL
jgi:hypothetical protein